MEIRLWTIADLRRELESDQLWGDEVVPITRHRARSQVANPRAEEHDPVLLAASVEGRVVAYLGMLPDRASLPGVSGRFAWVSTWWVDPGRAPGGLGAMLLLKALALWNGRVGVAGFNDDARRVYEGCGRFLPVRTDAGVTAVLWLEAEALGRRLPGVAARRPLPYLVAAGVNLAQGMRLGLRRLARSPQLALDPVRTVDLATAAFIERTRRPELSHRGPAELEWMISHPWVVARPDAAPEDLCYAFSALADRCELTAAKLVDEDGSPVAFLLLHLRDGLLKTPFAVFAPADADRVVAAVLEHMIRVGATRWSTWDPLLTTSLSAGGWPFLKLLPVERLVVFARELVAPELGTVHLHDGEGDGAFT